MKRIRAFLVRYRVPLLATGGFVPLVALLLGFQLTDQPLSSQQLYQQAQNASPSRTQELYQQLGEELPEIEEYFQLEMARTNIPSLEAIDTLQLIITARPHSPAAYEAHLIVARYYAGIGEVSAAEKAYRAALALEDTPALRRELAHYLAEADRRRDAYDEFHALLAYQPDAFIEMRRYGDDPLQVAADLNAATYFSDALETLQGVNDKAVILLRAEAYIGLGLYEQAEVQYRTWLSLEPEDVTARLGLANALAALGRTDDALAIYEAFDADVARADLLVDEELETALILYRASDDPIAWWNAATILEQSDRPTEALSLYARIAASDSYLADDAAYRLLVLAEETNNTYRARQAKRLLAAQGFTYLGLQAQDESLSLPIEPPYGAVENRTLEKVEALESLVLHDFAIRELMMMARFDPRPEVAALAAQELAARGEIVEAQAIAEQLLTEQPRRPLAVWRLAYPMPYTAAVMDAAETAEIDPLLIWAVMREESRFDPEALSFANAQGLMQVIPATRDWIAEQLRENIQPDAMFDPETNIRFGTWYLGFLLQAFDGDTELAITAYNGGPGSVAVWLDAPEVETRDDFYRWIGFGETREYLSRVMLSYLVYQHLQQLEETLSR